MSIVKAHDVCHVRFQAPDRQRMHTFLSDFGLVGLDGGTTPDAPLYMRGHGERPFLHATHPGPPAFLGFGLVLSSVDDLHRLAAFENQPVTIFDAPGGGYVVHLTDPDGFRVEVVAGQTRLAPLPTPSPTPWNEKDAQRRKSALRRVRKGPAHVLRLGHVVLGVHDFRRSEAWYKERFGFITSDEVQTAPGVAIGAFMRCDRGDATCDHHTLFLMQRPVPAGFMHAAFEVVDVDDLMAGHDYLTEAGHAKVWGVGRHLLGSQVFDYWTDPWGHEVEHWTDGDQLTATDGGGVASFSELISVQWGMKMPPLPGGEGA